MSRCEVCGGDTDPGSNLCPDCRAFAAGAGLTPEELSRHWQTMLRSSAPAGDEFKQHWQRARAGLSPEGSQPDAPCGGRALCRGCGADIPTGRVLCATCQARYEYADFRERELQAQISEAAAIHARRRTLAIVLPLSGAVLAVIAALTIRPGDERLYLGVGLAVAGGMASAVGALSARKQLETIGPALGAWLLFFDAWYMLTQDLTLALQVSGAVAAALAVLWVILVRVARPRQSTRDARSR